MKTLCCAIKPGLCRLVSWLAMASLMTGCATYNKIAPYPKPEKPVAISVGNASLSKMSDLPLGAYYDEPQRIIVTGYQKGLGVGMMFGLVGVLVADSANKSAGEDRFGADSAKMTTDMPKLTQDILTQELMAHPMPAVSKVVPASGDVVVTPFAVFTVCPAGTARLYAMLKVEMPGPDGDPKWSVRYFARAQGEYPVEGADGWSVANRFSDGMRFGLQRDVTVLLKDIQGGLTASHKVKAKGQYPFLGSNLELPFILVDENHDYVVGRLALGDVLTLAGTHILNRADYSFVDADFSSP